MINALTDLLHRERFYIRDINDKKGYIYAQQGVSMLAFGRTCVIRIFEEQENVVVEVRCSNKMGIGIPGIIGSVERKILQRLKDEL